LQVAICGAAPGMVHSVRLHSDCSSSELQVNSRGEVYSSDGHSFSKLTPFYLISWFTEKSIRNTLILQANLVRSLSRVMNAPLSLFPARITLFHSRAASVPEDRVSVSAAAGKK
jgi:hypothetical protein